MTVKIGTDCSGMEAPVQALRNLSNAFGVNYAHVFSCDIDKHARATIEANFPHGKMYEDLTKRNNATAPYSDLYVAGFPCQPFSLMGSKQGFSDTRGTIFFNVRQYIEAQQPKVFMLENVSGLKAINKGTYFDAIWKSLEDLGTYNLHFNIMNTKEHGVPHNRKRCYFVGIRKDVDKGTFKYPEPIKCPNVENFLEKRVKCDVNGLPPVSQTVSRANVQHALRTLKREGSDPFAEPFVVDCDSTRQRMSWKHGLSPCITCGRKDGHWVTNRGRRLLKEEMMRLQGMDPTLFKVVVTQTQLGKQLGNTMSVNVLERMFCQILPAAGLVKPGVIQDRWANGDAVKHLKATRGLAFATGPMEPWHPGLRDVQKGRRSSLTGRLGQNIVKKVRLSLSGKTAKAKQTPIPPASPKRKPSAAASAASPKPERKTSASALGTPRPERKTSAAAAASPRPERKTTSAAAAASPKPARRPGAATPVRNAPQHSMTATPKLTRQQSNVDDKKGKSLKREASQADDKPRLKRAKSNQ